MSYSENNKPVVLLTGASGNLGSSIAAILSDDYEVIGIDREAGDADFPVVEADLTDAMSIETALEEVRMRCGHRLASVIHLAAFFDFTGEEHPLYTALNVEGTRLLLRALQARFQVDQFIYVSTMLVHAPADPGQRIDERAPIGPRWAYPKSKAAAEAVVQEQSEGIPFVLLRLAGVYDEKVMVPTLAHQIARIFERDLESHLYSGSKDVGQSMLHREDMLDAFRRTVDRRASLPSSIAILVGEPSAVGYSALQDRIGELIHGQQHWPTLRVPKAVAAAGTWVQDKLEPVIPDAIDKGQQPFIKPFMIRMADDHYALDVSRAEKLLGWTPRHSLEDTLPAIVENLRQRPLDWYEANGVAPPAWLKNEEA
jgi:nucleoside-diphosphate-sugar epimerase